MTLFTRAIGMQNEKSSFFGNLVAQPPDAVLGLIRLFEADPRPDKLDLGVGVYRNSNGATPVLNAIKIAETELLSEQTSKSYLGPEGNIEFLEAINSLLSLGDKSNWSAVQTPGGCGALRLASQVASAAQGGSTLWLGMPSWPNHRQIFEAAGLAISTYRMFEPQSGKFDFDATVAALDSAAAGDLMLLHGCCHNPTGADPTPSQWRDIANLLSKKQVIPLIDLAYHGLGNGLEDDLVGVREICEAVDEALLAYSCDKNFGLYRERTGALLFRSRGQNELITSNVFKVARESWSMPPDHGAAVVAKVLRSDTLTNIWHGELTSMRQRIKELRRSLASANSIFQPLVNQNGLFALLALSPSQIERLRVEDAIYMAGSGRINIAGLGLTDIGRLSSAVERVRDI